MDSAAASQTFRFKPPYQMADHGSGENGINWIDSHIVYREFHTVLSEAVTGYAHIYAYGVSKCSFLTGMTERPFHNLEEIKCPPPESFNHKVGVPCPATSFPNSLAQPKPRLVSTIG